MDADQYFGNFLKAEDLKAEVDVVIKSVRLENLEGEERLIVYFHELRKSLVLNRTNKDKIKEIMKSSETDTWIGKKIRLGVKTVDYKGEPTPAVRVVG